MEMQMKKGQRLLCSQPHFKQSSWYVELASRFYAKEMKKTYQSQLHQSWMPASVFGQSSAFTRSMEHF